MLAECLQPVRTSFLNSHICTSHVVILMSGHPLDEEQVNWQQLGVTAWLEKPPRTLQLAQAIAKALHPT